jgi:hypothetical protein
VGRYDNHAKPSLQVPAFDGMLPVCWLPDPYPATGGLRPRQSHFDANTD